jgi:hypothetical protein
MMRNYYNGWNFESIVFGDKSILEKFSKEESKYEYINFLVIKANKRVEIIKKESELDFSIGDVLVYYKKEAISYV